jgi:hypothetical protein
MPILDRLAREQCEKAFASYINTHKTGTALATPVAVEVRVRKGTLTDDGAFTFENVDEIPLPCIAVSCPRVKPHESVGYPICELHVLVLTSVDEQDAADRASARFGYLAELFSDDKLATLMAAMNQPVSGPDNRVIKNFNLFGFALVEDMGQETDRHWMDHLVFEVHCNPTDDTNGDGSV